MQAINKIENIGLFKVWSGDRDQLGEVQKRIILKRIAEPIASNVCQYNCSRTEKK
jgi:hypothetical protein